MYEHFYRLERAPFRITPDPEFLYLSPSHKEALGSIVYGVEQRKGFIAVVGEVGLGKTAIVRYFLATRDPERLRVAYVFDARVSFAALLETVFQELGIPDRPAGEGGMVRRLHEVLVDEFRQGRNVVLIVDEAQNMPVETLEQLRVLSNLESSTDKLLQIVLIGQSELADLLDRHELRQLKQRIAVRATLQPFTRDESAAYVAHRLAVAGVATESVFTTSALRRIVRHARGVPRVLNIVCDNALVTGLGYRRKPVTGAIAGEVIRDLGGRRAKRLGWIAAAMAALCLLAGAVVASSPYRDVIWRGLALTREVPPAQQAADPAPAGTLPISPPAVPAEETPAPEPVERASTPAPAAVPAPAGAPVRTVKAGDNLYRLALEVYGFSSPEVLQRILDSNQHIPGVDTIFVGTTITFPDASDLLPGRPKAADGGQ